MVAASLVLCWALLALATAGWDIEQEFQLIEAGNTRLVGAPQCLSASIHAVLGALEIAQQRLTGQQIKYSVQEVVDCHNNGCSSGSPEEYITWLQVQDRLAAEAEYTNYRAKVYSCRANMAPDALTAIKVTGYQTIAVADFETAIQTHGSVLACMDTSSDNCPIYRDYEDSIIDGYSSDVCMHWVTIVGYTDYYYRARNSYGADWGENGYFRILRGGNKCGIETNMAVMLTEERTSDKAINGDSGCPLDFPNFCPGSKTCRATNQVCQEIDESAAVAQQQVDLDRGRTIYRKPSKRSTRNIIRHSAQAVKPSKRSAGHTIRHSAHSVKRSTDECEDVPNMRCERLQQYCKYANIQKVCAGTCEICAHQCVDREDYAGQCAQLVHFCAYSAPVAAKCAVTCRMDPRDCGSLGDQVNTLVKYDQPPRGRCYPPTIPNGAVSNQDLLGPGEQVYVVCEDGYVLSGEASICEIQNIFSPDSRRLQACIPDTGEDFTGRGTDYNGVLATTLDGQACDNWQEMADTGYFDTAEQGREWGLEGNHNFCRNGGGDDMDLAPYCIVHKYKSYCFELPHCGGDVCTGEEDAYPYCSNYPAEKCNVSDEHGNNRVKWYWDNCKASCCAAAGCQ